MSAGVFVIVRVNYTSENIDGVACILEVFRDIPCAMKKNASFDFQRVWQDRKDKFDSTEERMKSIRTMFANNGFTVLANYIPHNVECSCYGDKLNHALINYDGMVFGCTARDFVRENSIGQLSPDGTITYFKDKYEKRNCSKLSKPVCLTCRIAPICGGGCKQRAFEDLGNSRCTFGYTSEDMDGIVTDIFEHSFLRNNR